MWLLSIRSRTRHCILQGWELLCVVGGVFATFIITHTLNSLLLTLAPCLLCLLLLTYSWQNQPSPWSWSFCPENLHVSSCVLPGIPVSDVTLEIQPPEGQLTEGENLLLICSVAKGTGTVTFSWHREGTVRSLGRKTQRSLSAVLQILTVKESDAGRYYCAADNIHGPILSKLIRVTLRSKFSILSIQPQFTSQGLACQLAMKLFGRRQRNRGVKI